MTVLAEPLPNGITTSPSPAPVPAGEAENWLEVTGRLTMENLPGRDLDAAELLELAGSIAADPLRWREHVAFSDDKRHFVSLHRDTHVDIWVLCWTPQNDTGWHDHDISSGAVAVTQGRLMEHNLAVDGDALQTEIPAGKVYSFGPEHIH